MVERPKSRNQLRVALLGASGFAGRSVRAELERAGMMVGGFDRSSGCDLLDLAASRNAIAAFAPDYIVNCAAVVGSIKYVTDFAADVIDANMQLQLNLYRVARTLPGAVVINPIANCAFPGLMNEYEEDRLWDGPVHPSVLSYGSTRRMMDALARCYRQQFGVQTVNLFVPNMYGPGDSTDPAKTHALNALVIKFVAATKRAAPSIEVWGTGRPIREWLYVGDLARVIQHVVAMGEVPADPVNIAQNSGLSVRELVEVIRCATGYTGEIIYNTDYPDGAPRKVMNDERFRREFPDFVFTSFEQGLLDTIDYYSRLL